MKRVSMYMGVMAVALSFSVVPGQAQNKDKDKNTADRTANMGGMGQDRSEEHTSELQSLRHLVCRLLLEKKFRGTRAACQWMRSPANFPGPSGFLPAEVRGASTGADCQCLPSPANFRGCFVFFFNDTATTEIYTLSLHDALPICTSEPGGHDHRGRRCPADS